MKNPLLATAEQRLFEYLMENPGRSAIEIAEAIHTSHSHAQAILRNLHKAHSAYVYGWRKSIGEGRMGRQPIRLWSVGDHPDAPIPPKDTKDMIRVRRRDRLIKKFGFETACKILRPRSKGGPSTIHLDGAVVYSRSPAAGGRKRIEDDHV